jgi:hypothetical protein
MITQCRKRYSYVLQLLCYTKNDIDPQKWRNYVINNINDTKNSQIKNLLPQYIDKKY